MGRLSKSAGGSGRVFLTMLVSLFCLIFPGPSIAQESGSISGTVYNADGEIPFDQSVYVQVVQGDPCEHWTVALQVNIDPATGAFTLFGVPADQPVFLRISNTGFTNAVENWWNSTGGSIDCSQAEQITLSSGQELTDLSLFTRHAGDISGTVFEADGETPVQNFHVYAVTDACDGMWLSGANTNETGHYTLTGIPEGTVYVKTCAECNDHPFVNQIYDGDTGTLDCDQALGVPVTAGDTTPGIDFWLEPGVTISGRVTDNQGNPIQDLWLHAFDNACGGIWLGGGRTNDQGYYTTSAMPPGDTYIEACPRCDDFQFNNSWWTGTGNPGSTNCNDAWNLNLQAGVNPENVDFTLEYPIFVEIHNRHRPGDLFDAYYGIYFFNFNNFDLDSVVSITMTGPDGTPVYHYTRGGGDQNDFMKNQWNGFQVSAPGVQPEVGEYTFDVVTDDFSTTFTHVRIQNITIPLVDPASMSPAADSVITSRIPVFEWGGIEDPPMAVYYRIQVYDDTGYRIYASQREADLRSIALPESLLEPGRTYFWIVSVYDTHDGNRVENASHTASSAFTLSDVVSNSSANPPAIDLDGWGAVAYGQDASGGPYCWIKVTDYDGIAYDGSSHEVSVMFNGTTKTLDHSRSENAFTAYYELWEGPNPAPQGDYNFTVTDPDGITVVSIDNLENIFLETPDHESFLVSLDHTSPAFFWDPVTDVGQYRVRIYEMDSWRTVWRGYPQTQPNPFYKIPPGVLSPNSDYRYRIEVIDSHSPLEIDKMAWSDYSSVFTTGEASVNPMVELENGAATRNSGDQGAYLYFFTKIHDAQGVPDNIQSVTATFPDNTTLPLGLYYTESSTCGVYYAEDFSLPIAAGEYTITVTDLDGNTHSVTDFLDVNPIGYPADATVNAVVNGTRVDVTWEEIDEAAFYRLEIYDMDGNRLHALNTTQNAYAIPAGFLREKTAYQYRITTWREFFDQEIDNSSRSVTKEFKTFANQQVDVQLSAADPDITIFEGDRAAVFGTAAANHITLESGAQAELINFPGHNTIRVESDADNFTVFRSGTVVTFQGTDGTRLKLPATATVQTIEFDDGVVQDLVITNEQVLLGGVPVMLSSVIIVTGKAVAGLPVVGTINIKDSSYPDKQSFSAINSDGSYTLNIDGTWVPPFLMWAEGWVNEKQVRLLSTFDLVEGATEINVNTTPATTTIIESAIGESASEIDPEAEPVPDQEVVAQIKATVQETLVEIFAVLGVSADFNLFESPIGEVGSPEDQLYDTLSFSTDEQNNIIIADAVDDTQQVVIDPDGDAADPSDEMLDSIVQTGDALTQIRGIMTEYFGLFDDGYLPDYELLSSDLLPYLADGFLGSGYGRDDFITWLSESETAGPVNQRLIGCAILRPMTTQYYGNIPVEENHDGYSEAAWVVVTFEISGRSFTGLTAFVKDGTQWKWYGNRYPIKSTTRAMPYARQYLYPAGAVTYLSGIHLWHNDIGNLALNMGITNLAVFNPAFAPEIIDGKEVNCVRLERKAGGVSGEYRLSNVPHYWNNDTLYELSKVPGDRLIDLDNLKSQETMEFVVIGLDDSDNPVRTWLYTIPEAPLTVSELEADPIRYFAGIEHNVVYFDPFPGNDGIFSWILPDNPNLFTSWATLGWDNQHWHWNELQLRNPAWFTPMEFSAWTSDEFNPGSLPYFPRTGDFMVTMRDTNHRNYQARKRSDPWSESLISVENDHLVFDVSHEWSPDNLNPEWSSLNARTGIRNRHVTRFEAPFVVESASATGNAYVETEIRLVYQPDEDLWNGDTNFIGVWARIRYDNAGLSLHGFVWGSRNADSTNEISPPPASGDFPFGKQLSFNQTYHLAVEYLETTNQLMIEFTDGGNTYQSFYDMDSIENFEFDPDNFLFAEIRTRVRSLQGSGDSGSMRVRIDDTTVDSISYDDFTDGFSNSKWDILSYE